MKSNAPTGPTVLDLADRPPAVNRVTDCSGASQAPDLIDAQFIVERTPGACCLADSCLILMADQCGSFGGEYLGNGVPCDPNPCSPLASAPHGSVGPPLGGLRAIPNPTAGEVEILYGTERTGPATFKVFNARGVVVRRVALAAQAHGSHGIRWDGKDQSGHPVPSGIYVIRIEAADGVASGKVVVVRK